MKFTFKTIKSTGRYGSFYPDSHRIKLNKKEVGNIADCKPFKIRLMIEKEITKEDPAPFKWVTLAKNSDTLVEAKKFLNDMLGNITTKYKLYSVNL